MSGRVDEPSARPRSITRNARKDFDLSLEVGLSPVKRPRRETSSSKTSRGTSPEWDPAGDLAALNTAHETVQGAVLLQHEHFKVPTRSEAQSITAELDKGAANVQSEDEDDLFETPRGSNEELNLQLQDARRNRTFRGSVDGLIGDVAEEHDITKGSEAEIFDSPGSKTIVHSTPVTTDKTARALEPRPGVSTVKQRLFQPPIADLRPPPAAAMAGEINTHKIAINMAKGYCENELDEFDPGEYPLDYVKEELLDMTKKKKALTAAMAALQVLDNDTYLQTYKLDAERSQSQLLLAIKAGMKHVKDAEREVATRAAARDDLQAGTVEIKRNRVRAGTVPLSRRVDTLVNTLREVENADPTADRKGEVIIDKMKMYSTQVDEVLRDVKSLYNDATATAMADEARELEKKCIDLKAARMAANEAVENLKDSLNLNPSSAGSKNRLVDLVPPVFNGIISGKNLDAFSFWTEFKEYGDAKSLTNNERVILLKKVSLQGAPKTLVTHKETMDEIWEVLKANYGDAMELIYARADDIKKVGKCEGTSHKKREWAIDVRAKLTRLHEIAIEHGKAPELYHSPLIGDLKDLLPYTVAKDFRDAVKVFSETQTTGLDVSRQQMFEQFLVFLDDLIGEETFNLRFCSLTVGADKPASKQSKGPDPTQGKPQTRSQTRGQGKNKGYVAAPATPAPTAMPAGPQPTKSWKKPGNNNSKNNTRPQPAKSQQSQAPPQQQRSGQAPPQQQRSGQAPPQYEEPKHINCCLCNRTHQHLFDCGNFQSKSHDDRVNLAGYLATCHRCLRLDSRVNFTMKRDWWERHTNNCVTDWACEIGNCKQPKISRQKHIVMCEYHSADNEKRLEDFVSTLDQSFVAPDYKFFFMGQYNYANYPPIEPVDIEEDDVVPDHNECLPSIYILQMIPGGPGVDLMGFFDTGCSTLSLTKRAAKLLNSETRRPGPTILNVAGGGKLEIPYGDERFTLPLVEGGKAALTGLMMDTITDEFPLWPLQAAWLEVKNAYEEQVPDGLPLPAVDDAVGGRAVDIMFGIRYNQHFPELNYMLPSGLAVYTAQIQTPSGNLGILGGSHKSWIQAMKQTQYMDPQAYFSCELRAHRAQQMTMMFVKEFETNRYCFGETTVGLDHDEAEGQAVEDPGAGSLVDEPPVGGQPRDEGSEQVESSPAALTAEELDPNDDGRAPHLVEVAPHVDEGKPGKPEIKIMAKNDEYDEIIAENVQNIFTAKGGKMSNFFSPKNDEKKFTIPQNQTFYLEGIPLEPVLCGRQHCPKHHEDKDWVTPSSWVVEKGMFTSAQDELKFWQTEDVGSELSYRCISCRNCSRCRDGDHQEAMSLADEADQALIEGSVYFDPKKKRLMAALPFVLDPEEHLQPNRFIAEKIFARQMQMIEKNPEMREDVLKSHEKLESKGFVIAETEIPEDTRQYLELIGGAGYYIPWQVVFKPSSLSTPVRIVMNASSATPGGKSLNTILAKGDNSLSKIYDVLLDFRGERYALTADIRTAYNGVDLEPQYYKFQRYLWKKDLNPTNPIITMVTRTLMYGVKSAGQQTTAGFKCLADYSNEHHSEHSEGAEVIRRAYMDDLGAAAGTMAALYALAASISFILALGQLCVKCFTYSTVKPSDVVSADGQHVGVLGYRWDPEKDTLKLDVKDLYFGKPKRGKLPPTVTGDFGEQLKKNFTKREMVGMAAKVYDPLGLCTPLMAKIKLDLHQISDLKVDWDDKLPPHLLITWIENIKTMQILNELEFRRAMIPINAANSDIHLIGSCDASMEITIAAIHARVELEDGTFSCQLLTGKSKLVKGATIPRAELKGAVLVATMMHTVVRNLRKHIKSVTFVTDSAICLHWLNQDYRPLQVAVRNSVIEIRRLSLPERWFHVETFNNIADLGTRPASVEEIASDSDWQNGKPWMRGPAEKFPIKTVQELILSPVDKQSAAKEMRAADVGGHLLDPTSDKVCLRYKYSKYIVDPCARKWPISVGIMGMVLRAVDIFSKRKAHKGKTLSPGERLRAENYFFEKGTLEVKKFCPEKSWRNVSFEKERILLFNGRILDIQEVNSVGEVMVDLSPVSFVKPLLERYSPLAYSIMTHCHQVEARHQNSVATLRESMSHAHILGGRDLAEEVRRSCPHCKRFKKKLLQVEMGKLHKNRLTIAPAYTIVGCDLMGPFEAACEHNHRSKVKVWGAIFKCLATCHVTVHVMTKCDTSAFLLAYTRFASRYGHPQKLVIDAGGQLIKGCEEMEVNLHDIEHTLDTRHQVGIEHEVVPVGGHNANGQAERAIKDIKKIFFETYNNLRLDIMGYETAFSWVCNEINNMPICLGSRYRDLENLDLITPNRLTLGRNNRRSLSGCATISTPSRMMNQMQLVYDSWWTAWKKEKIVCFAPQPKKWSNTSYHPKIGDIVVFQKDTQVYGEPVWRVGRIIEAEKRSDNHARKLVIEYKLGDTETPVELLKFKTVNRSTRQVAVLHEEGALELIDALNLAAKEADINYIQRVRGWYTDCEENAGESRDEIAGQDPWGWTQESIYSPNLQDISECH